MAFPFGNATVLESHYEVVVARAPFGLEIADNCLNCSLRSDTFFCSLPKDALQNFQSIASPAAFPSDAVLFVEGQQPRGIYVLCSGKVKLSMGSAEGKVLILRIAEAGEVLGISATVSGRPYDLTAETLEPTQANFVRRDDFLRFLQKHSTACFRAAQQLSDKYDVACREIRSLGLSHSAAEKLAMFLLQLAARDVARGGKGNRIRVTLTHEEIAQMIGTSRETVTRLLTELRRKQFIGWKGSILEIRNKAALQALVGS